MNEISILISRVGGAGDCAARSGGAKGERAGGRQAVQPGSGYRAGRGKARTRCSRTANQLLTDLSGGADDRRGACPGADELQKRDQRAGDAQIAYRARRTNRSLSTCKRIRDGMRQYGLSAKDALDLEQRLLDVQAQIAARDAQSLDSLLGRDRVRACPAATKPCATRSFAMLSQSREAWKTWQESSTGAIQAQIDALDALIAGGRPRRRGRGLCPQDRKADAGAYVRAGRLQPRADRAPAGGRAG